MLLLIGLIFGWLGQASTAAGANSTVPAPEGTSFGNVNASHLMPPSDGAKGKEVYPRAADDRFVYVQRKISTNVWKIDVCAFIGLYYFHHKKLGIWV